MNAIIVALKQLQGRLVPSIAVAVLLTLTLLQGGGIVNAYRPVVEGLWDEFMSANAQEGNVLDPFKPAVLGDTNSSQGDACTPGEVENVVGEFVPQSIIASKVGINLPIIPVPLENGTWKVNDHVANFAQGTSFLSTNGGNVGLFGHDRKSAFRSIKDLNVNDTIEVFTTKDGIKYKFTYYVEHTTQVTPDQVNVFAPTSASVVTLVTCDGLFSETRHVVRAALVKVERISCNE